MNEHRQPVEIWMKRLPQDPGNKKGCAFTLKIELFPLHLWSQHWDPTNALFSPKLPLRTKDRIEFWESRYRIRVNGKWVGKKAKYVGYTKEMIRRRYFG